MKIFSSVEGKNEILMKLKKHNWLKKSHRLMPYSLNLETNDSLLFNYYMHAIQSNLRIIIGIRNKIPGNT